MVNRFLTLLLGCLSCLVTAFLNFYIEDLTTFNVFSLSIYGFVPVGAFLVGMAANSGYYLSAFLTDRMLDKYDFMAMVAMAVMTMFLIYGIEYYFYVVKAGLSPEMTFWQYVAYVTENSALRLKFAKFLHSTTSGPMGAFGYLFLMINLLGFIVGGAATFMMMTSLDTCAKCSRYMRPKDKKTLFFMNPDEFTDYKEQLDTLDPLSPTFATILSQGSPISTKQKDAVKYTWQLKKCKECAAEILCGKAERYNGKDWVEIIDTEKKVSMPAGASF